MPVVRANQVRFHYEYIGSFQEGVPTLVCLHGFTGTLHTFDFLVDQLPGVNILALDLIGHGQTSVHVPTVHYTMSQVVKDVRAFLEKLGLTECFLFGYSMGGRVALAFATTFPKMVLSLILESSTAGIKEAVLRANRRKQDQKWIHLLREEGLKDFVQQWQEVPLFASQKALPQAVQLRVYQERMSQNRWGLANSLAYMGTGAQMNYWPQLTKMEMPLLYLAGEFDAKFCQIGQEMVHLWQNQAQLEIISGAGHCIHLENPKAVVDNIKKFVENGKSK
ncbi:2-succinyl-6-hydroxy-2,4-cyclohexadiene-1-carboxylate synthase [Enterococcus cecorum]|uniref:2-succinyl-6-hydroxy-2, 4-cyclohexadiene-1-carboxylate synthase n=1 Tax=Enterococcus cecorum TaxID=44008 RepID=UPI001FAD30F9|nr:2-succinyl-6-hydroxy-2,4-cyclohexadiene-1-carboxylate synthase [Enterococcus cecorum]MCJ0571092.1 2-succinyl-6-hydroxy-2,4-cyclohexadiene-1-carboxylate synthase [Enterococcus cecorum]MCJ0588944.1 2-succinyl-6-hydroxy-2,4-cyclohexadiene-1-carboxylate synthase [Enterococcus cecorum]